MVSYSRLLFIGLLFLNSYAHSVDIVSFFLKGCKIQQGVILEATDSTVTGFDINGRHYTLDRNSIELLVLHRIVNNPIPRIHLNPELISYAKEVYVDNKEQIDFVGWPVRYAENLIIFHDTQGNTHVLDLYKIKKIRPANLSPKKSIRFTPTPVYLNLKDAVTQCRLPKNTKGLKHIQPTRLLADNVQISETLDTYMKGFQKFKSYEERTFLYAKPYLFERDTRMGYLIFPDEFFELSNGVLPLYFQWSSGSEYRFQSFTQVGGLTNENAPSFEPFNLLRSDVKSHMFHASFVGNAIAVSAGSEYFTRVLDLKSNAFDKPTKFRSAMFFNYMILMGMDYGPWSFFIGPMYPIYFFKIEDEFREVLAASVNPVFRIMYTTEKFQLRGIFSTQSKNVNNPNDLDLSIDTSSSTVGQVNDFELNSSFLRLGIDYNINEELSIGGDILFIDGDYSESTPTSSSNRIEYLHQNIMLRVNKRFGDYVSMKFYSTFININRDISFYNFAGNKKDSEFTTGGAFEFIF